MSKPSPRHASAVKARRGLASAGVMSLALAGGAFAMAGADSASAASGTANYTCQLTNEGLEKTFSDPWKVTMTVDMPSQVEPGATIPAPKISANVVTGNDAASQLRSLNVKTVEGTAKANYSFGSATRSVDLTIPKVSVPASGGIVTLASGQGAAETAPSTATTVTVSAGSFTTTQTTDSGFILKISCTPAKGANTTVGTIKVGASTPAPTSTTSTPAPTKSSTTPAPTTSTSAPTTPAPTSTTSTPAPTTSTSAPASTSPAPTTSTSAPASTSPAPSTSPSTSQPTVPAPGHDHGKPGDPKPGHDHGKPCDHKPGHDGDHKPGHDGGMPSGPVKPTMPAPTQPAPATQAPGSAQGPKVDTDYVGADTANTAGIALAAAGVFALGGAAFAGRRSR